MASDHHTALNIAVQEEAERRKEHTLARDQLEKAVAQLDDIAERLEVIGDLTQYTEHGKLVAFKNSQAYVAPQALTASYDLQRELLVRQAETTSILDQLSNEVDEAARAVNRAHEVVRKAVEPLEQQLSDDIADEVEKAEHDLSEAFLKLSALSRSAPGLASFSPRGIAALSRSPRPIAVSNSPRALRWEAKVAEYSQLRKDLLAGVHEVA
jgi:DNA-binding ferritin-like protein